VRQGRNALSGIPDVDVAERIAHQPSPELQKERRNKMESLWRPKYWNNPFDAAEKVAFEAGADAMLAELKEQFDSEHHEAYSEHCMCNHCSGTWVFIPDKKERR